MCEWRPSCNYFVPSTRLRWNFQYPSNDEQNFRLELTHRWNSATNLIQLRSMIDSSTCWIGCRFPIEISTEPSPMMADFVTRVPVFHNKPSWLPWRMTFSLLIGISFYVSSRRVRICVRIERNPKISLDGLDHDDVFTVQAMTDWAFIGRRWLVDFIVVIDRSQLENRQSITLNSMPFSDRESNWPFSSYGGFQLPETGFHKNLHNFR